MRRQELKGLTLVLVKLLQYNYSWRRHPWELLRWQRVADSHVPDGESHYAQLLNSWPLIRVRSRSPQYNANQRKREIAEDLLEIVGRF